VAVFAAHHLGVTPSAPREMHAGGDYPAFGDSGLAAWAAADRPVEDTDLVLWHVVGSTHLVRPEDWPVMPVERVGFALKPLGFFDRNPALDLPPPAHADHCAPAGQPSDAQRELPGRSGDLH
jgi:primary-amine oxidase